MPKGVIEVHAEFLMEHLLLLKGYKLEHIYLTHENVLELIVENDSIPEVPDGVMLPRITPTYRKADYELVEVKEDDNV